MIGRKAGFWIAVGGTAILANFLMQIAADKIKNQGFRDLVGYINRGGESQ